MTSTAPGRAPTSTCTTIDNDLQIPKDLRQLWSCSCCNLSFDTAMVQKDHLKSSWHVYNLKRRITSLPPIPLPAYEGQIKIVPMRMEKQTHNAVERSEKDQAIVYKCLFCASLFDATNEGLEQNMNHMLAKHGFFIPNQAALWDVESFLEYLTRQVRIWHECLYCGRTKVTTQSIQHHMRDSGHCKLNFQKEPELLEFWEHKPEVPRKPTSHREETSMGSTEFVFDKEAISARLHRLNKKRSQAHQTQLVPQVEQEPAQSERRTKHRSCDQLVCRNEMGVRNISLQQHHALITAVKRSQKDEALAKRAKEWSCAQRANDQKHDQAYGALSWAKGGMHNLLPR